MRVRIAAQTFPELPSIVAGNVVGYGVAIDAPAGIEGYVTSVGPAVRSAPGPNELLSVIEFVVNFTTTHTDEITTGLVGAWLYDKLTKHRPGAGPRRLTMDGVEVDPDDWVAVERAVRDHLSGRSQASDGDAGG